MNFILTIFFLLLQCFFDVAFARQNVTPLFYSDSNLSILATVNQPVFTIKLKSNPTTGYSWSLKNYDAKVIQSIKHVYQAPNHGLIGQSGFELWTFRVKPAGFNQAEKTTTISMIYARPWQPSDHPTQLEFKVTLAK